MSKCYLKCYPRPVGLEPTIYLYKPEVCKEVVEVEPGYLLEDPFSNPEVSEYRSIEDALIEILKFNPNDDYLSNLKIVKEEKPKGLTTHEKDELAYQRMERIQEVNRKICEIGACIHKEHQK